MTTRRLLACACVLLAGCTNTPRASTSPAPSASSQSPSASSASPTGAPRAGATPPPIASWSALASLPVATSRAVAFADAASLTLAGGLGAGRSSTAAIWRYSFSTSAWARDGTLAVPVHDAAGARLGGRAIVFGGGSGSSTDVVQELRSGARSVVIGRLPEARSDASAVVVGGRAFVVGGYNGKTALRDVLETTDGKTFRVFARLPVGVRYAAVAVVGTTIYVFGGQTTSGADTDAVQTIDAAGNAHIAARMRETLAHALAVANGFHILVAGGEHGGAPRSAATSFDARTGRATPAPDAPYAFQDAAVARRDDVAYAAGGEARGKNLRAFERIAF